MAEETPQLGSRRLRVVFTRVFPSNPYQLQLAEGLSQHNVSVELDVPGTLPWSNKFNGKPVDILHLHWIHPFYLNRGLLTSARNSMTFVLKLNALKTDGVKLVWTVHDLGDMEERHQKLDLFVHRRVGNLVDAVIVHSKSAKDAVVERFGIRDPDKVRIVPHGNYVGCYANQITREAAREELGISGTARVFLFLGEIKEYKGVDELLDAFDELKVGEKELIVAGRIHDGEAGTRIGNRIRILENVKLFPGYVPDDEIQTYMNSCDVVVFPYKKIFTSGALLLAMSFARACIVPDFRSIRDVIDDSGGFFFAPNQENSLLHALERAMEAGEETGSMGEHNRKLAERWDWAYSAAKTAAIYEQLG